jgi:GNAT superfamily N-acetyltransferase
MYFEWPTSLTESDKAQMLAILNAVAGKEGTNGIPRPLSAEEAANFTSDLDRALRHGDCHQLFARDERNSLIVAIATLEQVKMNPARAHVVEIKRMASAPDRRGFGRFLLEGWRVILEKCRELGCDIINIDVSEDGPYQMWEKLGFRVYAEIADYARVGDRRLNGYFLHMYVREGYEALDRFTGLSRCASAGSAPRAPREAATPGLATCAASQPESRIVLLGGDQGQTGVSKA